MNRPGNDAISHRLREVWKIIDSKVLLGRVIEFPQQMRNLNQPHEKCTNVMMFFSKNYHRFLSKKILTSTKFMDPMKWNPHLHRSPASHLHHLEILCITSTLSDSQAVFPR